MIPIGEVVVLGVGVCDGVGVAVGLTVGVAMGPAVGVAVATIVGVAEGATVGVAVGTAVGVIVGVAVATGVAVAAGNDAPGIGEIERPAEPQPSIARNATDNPIQQKTVRSKTGPARRLARMGLAVKIERNERRNMQSSGTKPPDPPAERCLQHARS